MALSQIQVIQSLAEALSWFEKELSWGVEPAELNHLTGRIGELYVAMITRGQMALETNQRGYDVISAENERISVKTVTTSSHVSFNQNTFEYVDRVMVLRVNSDEEHGVSVEELLDESADEFFAKAENPSGKITFSTSSKARTTRPLEELEITKEAFLCDYRIFQYENGTIKVQINDETQNVTKPVLRDIATEIGMDILNQNGGEKNTRQLGADIINSLNARLATS